MRRALGHAFPLEVADNAAKACPQLSQLLKQCLIPSSIAMLAVGGFEQWSPDFLNDWSKDVRIGNDRARQRMAIPFHVRQQSHPI